MKAALCMNSSPHPAAIFVRDEQACVTMYWLVTSDTGHLPEKQQPCMDTLACRKLNVQSLLEPCPFILTESTQPAISTAGYR